MSLIRPEVSDQISRWREALLGAVVLAFGLRWALGSGVLAVFGILIALIGGALIYVGILRGRLRRPGRGAGVLQLVEGQLGYFGPDTGGVVAVDLIQRISKSGDTWLIEDTEGTRLEIPANAAGADCLFDVFAMLPGLDMSTLASDDPGPRETALLWTRPSRQLH